MPGGTAIIIVVFGVVLVVAIAIAIEGARKRREELTNFALANGWSFTERDDRFARMWRGDPFHGFGDGQARDIFQGVWQPTGHQFVALTYSYTETSTDAQGHTTSHTYYFEVRALRLPRQLPPLALTPEGFFSKVGKFFGGQDIELESDDFNRAFRVTSAEPRFAYGVLHPQVMEWMMGPGRALVPWRIDNGYLITYETGRLDIQRFPHRIGLMAQLTSTIPKEVWDTFGR